MNGTRPATREEFGLWFAEQAGISRRRLACGFAAQLRQPAAPDRLAAALGRVLDRHPECSSVYSVDATGTLIRTAGVRPAELTMFGPEIGHGTAVAVLADQSVSAATGPVLRLGLRLDGHAQADHVYGVAHHVIWDGRSEELFWDTLCQELHADRPSVGAPTPTSIRGGRHSELEPPDPQWSGLLEGPLGWAALRLHAARAGLTPFLWIVGHLAVGVAAWSAAGRVDPYIDFDLRAIDAAPVPRIGFRQVQCRLGALDAGLGGLGAAHRIRADVATRLGRAVSGSLRPEPEVHPADGQPCKFYVRASPSSWWQADLAPLDVAVAAARNELAVGVTNTSGRTHLTITARRGRFTPTDLDGLAGELLAALGTRRRPAESEARA